MAINFNFDRLPEELKTLKRWVLWKTKITEKGKTTKIPINGQNGYGAKSNDSETWSYFDEAKEKISYYGCKGLGFMLGSGYFGIDLDNHADENGKYDMTDEEFEKLVTEFSSKLNTYCEYSQSGKGVHFICKGVLPKGARHRGCVEMYDNVRFFVMTGNPKFDEPIVDCTESVKSLYDKYLNTKKEEKPVPETSAYVYSERRERNINVSGILSDNEVISKATESKNGNLFTCLYYGQWEGLGYPSQSEADMAFCSMLAFWCGKDENQMDRIFRSSKLMRKKWDELRGQDTYGNNTLNSAVANCHDVYFPQYDSNATYNPSTGKVVITKTYELNDTGNAKRYVDRFGTCVRYNFNNKCWMIYDGKTWINDVKQIIKTQADIMIDEMKLEAVRESDGDKQREMLKNIKHLSSNSGKEAMLKEAMHIGIIPTVNSDYDKDKYLLNCKNGVVNLRTGEISQHDKSYMFSKNTNIDCDMNGEPTRWIEFLSEIFGGDKELVDYIQTALGYSLSGDTSEQCMFQCYGDGSNGKSVFFDIVYSMMGEYAQNTQIDAILSKGNNSSGASSEIARMNGKRFIRTNEPNDGSRFNEGLLKQLVGGDVTTARFLYGNEFEFKPIFKLWIATNYKINIRGTDKGIWRRQRLIPFLITFEGRNADRHLTEKLMAELPKILGWCVRGCMKWLKDGGLKTPSAIEKANEIYRDEMDIVQTFIISETFEDTTGSEKAGDVYKAYTDWARNGKEYVMSQTKFGKEMAKKYKKDMSGGYIYYYGFRLKIHDTRYTYKKGK